MCTNFHADLKCKLMTGWKEIFTGENVNNIKSKGQELLSLFVVNIQTLCYAYSTFVDDISYQLPKILLVITACIR